MGGKDAAGGTFGRASRRRHPETLGDILAVQQSASDAVETHSAQHEAMKIKHGHQ